MTIARKHLVNPAEARFYHITTRCVRRAFLCGEGFEHRKEWIYRRLRFLARLFPIEVAGYAIMSNHLHLVVSYDPTKVHGWTADEIYQRWSELRGQGPSDAAEDRERRQRHINDQQWLEATKAKLGSLGWFMRELKYHLARQANREDGCTGHFWESRFKSVPLLDQAALAACMVYVDLNPIRAGTADRPENSGYTGVLERIQARSQETTHPIGAHQEASVEEKHDLPELESQVGTWHGERHPGWMLPIRACFIGPDLGKSDTASPSWLKLDEYLTLVDETGRMIRSDKRSSITASLDAILDRLDLDAERWQVAMRRGGQMYGTGLGGWLQRKAEALRRKVRWLANRCPLFSTLAVAGKM